MATDGRIYRDKRLVAGRALFAAVVLTIALTVFIAPGLVLLDGLEHDGIWSWLVRVVMFPTAIYAGVQLAAEMINLVDRRPFIELDGEGLRVRRFGREHYVQWRDITGVTPVTPEERHSDNGATHRGWTDPLRQRAFTAITTGGRSLKVEGLPKGTSIVQIRAELVRRVSGLAS